MIGIGSPVPRVLPPPDSSFHAGERQVFIFLYSSISAPLDVYFISATVAQTGLLINIEFSEAVTFGAGGNSGITLVASGGVVTASYNSGSTTDTLVYLLSRAIQRAESLTVSYSQPGDGIEANVGGQDADSFFDQVVLNMSLLRRISFSYSRFRRR
jgi:hypothetical protein